MTPYIKKGSSLELPKATAPAETCDAITMCILHDIAISVNLNTADIVYYFAFYLFLYSHFLKKAKSITLGLILV